MTDTRPLILLIFANDAASYLPSLREERQYLRELLKPVEDILQLDVEDNDYITIEKLLDLLNHERERLTVLHFAGHSGTDLLRLDEGQAHASGLVEKLRECYKLELVFLNGCNNLQLANAIYDAGIPNVIGTQQAINDDIAQFFSRSFYKALTQQQLTVKNSFEQAKSDVGTKFGPNYLSGASRSLDISQPKKIQQPWILLSANNNIGWRLANAALPCNRLPRLLKKTFPASPFKGLCPYVEADAGIFLGRCEEILHVMYLLDTMSAHVLLMYSGAGIGKSSFLAAGLIPHLKARGQTAEYRHYNTLNPEINTPEQLFRDFDPRSIQTNLSHPSAGIPSCVWIIDQMEEIFIASEYQQQARVPPALDKLLKTLKTAFAPEDGSTEPNVKIVLTLRKEWFTEILEACQAYGINYETYHLAPLNKEAIENIITSLVSRIDLKDNYRLKIEPSAKSFSQKIANNLLNDKQSNIAPTLQVILSGLWAKFALGHDERIWKEEYLSTEMYDGIENYLDQQLNEIAQKEPWGKKAYDSGLLIDILFAHATQRGTTKNLDRKDYITLYSHISYHDELIKSLQARTILIDSSTPTVLQTRLAHDTLAQIIEDKYDASMSPGLGLSR